MFWLQDLIVEGEGDVLALLLRFSCVGGDHSAGGLWSGGGAGGRRSAVADGPVGRCVGWRGRRGRRRVGGRRSSAAGRSTSIRRASGPPSRARREPGEGRAGWCAPRTRLRRG